MTPNQKTARRLVRERSGGDCEVRIAGVCLGRATNWHHRRNRSRGGLWLPSNGLDVCGSGTTGCHGALTNTNGYADVFRAAGWLVRGYQDPAGVAVAIVGRGSVWLSDDGQYLDTAPPLSVSD